MRCAFHSVVEILTPISVAKQLNDNLFNPAKRQKYVTKQQRDIDREAEGQGTDTTAAGNATIGEPGGQKERFVWLTPQCLTQPHQTLWRRCVLAAEAEGCDRR